MAKAVRKSEKVGARYTSADQISATDLKRWLGKSIAIQWDYKNTAGAVEVD